MANKKISDLVAVTAPTESDVLPIVNDYSTKKITIATLRTGIFTYDQTSTTGSGLSITRNLTAASTNSPLVSIDNQNASDDQYALLVQTGSTLCAGTKFYRNAATVAQGVGEEQRPIVLIEEANASAATESLFIKGISTGASEVYIAMGGIKADGDGTANALRLYTNQPQIGPAAGYLINAAVDATTSEVGAVFITANSSPTTPRGMLRLTNTGEQKALYIWTEADTDSYAGIYLDIHGDTNAIYATRNEATASNALFYGINDHASSTGRVWVMRQDGTGDTLFLDQNGNGIALNIDTEATSVSAIDIDAVNTSGIVLDIAIVAGGASTAQGISVSNAGANPSASSAGLVQVDNDGTGTGLLVRADGVLASSRYGIHIYSNAAQTAAALFMIEQDNASSTFPCSTMQNDGTGNTIFLDVNGNGRAIFIDAEGTSVEVIQISMNTITTGTMFDAPNADALTSGKFASWLSNSADTTARTLFQLTNDNALATGAKLIGLQQDSTGNALFIDVNANGLGLNIDKDCTVDNTRTWAMSITSDNAGTGTALGCGIDMSSFSVDEPIIKAVADAINTAGTLTGQIAIDIGGTTYYIPYYTTGSVV